MYAILFTLKVPIIVWLLDKHKSAKKEIKQVGSVNLTPSKGLHVFLERNRNSIETKGLKSKQGRIYFWNTNDQGEKGADAFARYLSDRFEENDGDGRVGIVEINLKGLEDKIKFDLQTSDMNNWFPYTFEPGESGEGYFVEIKNIPPQRLKFITRFF